MFKTDRVNDPSAIVQLGLVLNVILFAAVAYALRSLWVRVSALEQERAGAPQERATVSKGRVAVPQERATVSQGRVSGKPVNTGNVSPKLIAVITGAVAAYLDDEDMERHKISSIVQLPPQGGDINS